MNPLEWVEEHKVVTGILMGLFGAIFGFIRKLFRWKRDVDTKMADHDEALTEMRKIADRMENSTKSCQAHHTVMMEEARKEHGEHIQKIHQRVDDIYKMLVDRR